MKITETLISAALALGSLSCAAYTPQQVDEAMDFLYRYMPLPDSTDRSRDFYVEYAVKPALRAREEMPWGKQVSDNHFRHFVLPLRVNNEALDKHRPQFYEELKGRVKGLTMKDAVLEINHWCHEKVTYQPSDGRTHSPLQSVSSAIGRCGEESTFTVAALRAMGIPARQVYTPRWAHTDDNHAWVEAWADGEWYFLGACEPEPVLNLGWFNAPAARGMLMHARVFGDYTGEEEMLDKSLKGVTVINCTANYAPVDTLHVEIVDAAGKPVKDADVEFRLYNYAEFYPIASKFTDGGGNASLVCGLGDLVVWASDDNGHFGFRKASVGKDRKVRIALDRNGASTWSESFDIVPPPARTADVTVTEAMRAANDRRMAHEDSIRNAYTSTFDTSSPLLKLSRGNHAAVSEFAKRGTKAQRLLASLTEKDLTDVGAEVLEDHLAAEGDSTEWFDLYVMSPRIDHEELTPFRSELAEALAPLAGEMKAEPSRWVQWVKDNIAADMSWYPAQCTQSPVEVWKGRRTSPHSRDIFFVAGARTMGIPARIDPVTQKTQYIADGKWMDADFYGDTNKVKAPQGKLMLCYDAAGSQVKDPKYYTHFTLSKIEDGQPQLLGFPDFATLSEIFSEPYQLDAGKYLLVSGQRLADGSVLSTAKSIDVEPGTTTTDTLRIRHDDSALQVIGSFNAENKYVPVGGGDARSILSTTGRGYYVLGLIKPGNEPSNHALRDIAQLSGEFESLGNKIVLLFDSKADADRMDFSLIPALPATAVVGIDSDGTSAAELGAEKPLRPSDYPVFIVTDTFNRIVYRTDGYTIGLGQTLADILRRLK